MASQTDPRSPDYDPSAARHKAEEEGRRSGAHEERLKQAAKRRETVGTEKAKSHRRGKGEGRAEQQREHKARLADPTGPIARQARKSYKAGQEDLAAFLKQLGAADILAGTGRVDLPEVRQIVPDTSQRSLRGQRIEIGAPQAAPSAGGFIPVMNRQNGARIIMVLTGVSALAIIVRATQAGGGTVTTTIGGHKVVVSTNLRRYAAVVIVGTIALIVNEFSPAVGVGLSLALAIDIVINTGLLTRIGSILTGNPVSAPVGVLPPSASGFAPGAGVGGGGGGGGGGSWGPGKPDKPPKQPPSSGNPVPGGGGGGGSWGG